jgi:hypothetical protein
MAAMPRWPMPARVLTTPAERWSRRGDSPPPHGGWYFVARVFGEVAWRLPGRTPARLHAFAMAEAQSELELRRAAARSPSFARRALYLRHALDEARHARMFAQRADELWRGGGRAGCFLRAPELEHLYDRLGEVGCLAFVHLGEARGRAQFEAYRARFARRGDERTRTLFDAVLADERRHERYTRELLLELCGTEGAVRAALRRARAWELWRGFRRSGRLVSTALHAVVMTALYLVVAPLGLVLRRRRRPLGFIDEERREQPR